MKKPIPILIVACMIIVGLVGLGLWRFMFAERWHYAAADRDITRFMQSIQKQYPNSTITTNNYCSYSHQKYSKTLGCNVSKEVEVNAQDSGSVRHLEDLMNVLGWNGWTDITKQNQKTVSKDYIQSMVTSRENLTCGVHFINDQATEASGIRIVAECSGPAKLAWYPVKGE